VTGQGVLVIAIDGLRFDHTSLGGYDRETTPFLASLAESGISFTDAWSPTPSLVGSHVAILSGSDPMLARPPVDAAPAGAVAAEAADPWFIPEGLWLLGRSFLSRGWNTAAFVDDPQIAELSGFSAGFREFVEFGGDPLEEERSIGVFGVGTRFVEWANQRPLDENWFAYLQMHDLERVWTPTGDLSKTPRVKDLTQDWVRRKELSYAVPLGASEPLFHVLPPSRASDQRGVTMAEYELRYDRGLRALDANIARIIGHADDFGRAANLTIVIVGSFGMELGEHGLFLQAGLVEEEDLRVPLVIRPSAQVAERLGWGPTTDAAKTGRVSDALVSLEDLAPTLADLLDLPTSGRMLGFSQRRAMAGATGDGGTVEPSVRQRLFASSASPPGMAIVEKDAFMTLYRPWQASEALQSSWGLSLAEEGGPSGGPGADSAAVLATLRTRSQGIGTSPTPPHASEAKLRDLAERWEALVLRERRVLHFGDLDSDMPSVGEFRLLQEGGEL
jgi:arylsulfatase A-like enzyme